MKTYYRSFSFLEVTRGMRGKTSQKFYTVLYAGNMGASMTKVAHCFDELYGKGTFAQVKSLGEREGGSPDYCWSMLVPKADFERIVGKNL